MNNRNKIHTQGICVITNLFLFEKCQHFSSVSSVTSLYTLITEFSGFTLSSRNRCKVLMKNKKANILKKIIKIAADITKIV